MPSISISSFLIIRESLTKDNVTVTIDAITQVQDHRGKI